MSAHAPSFTPAATAVRSPMFRWGQLVMGIVCMAMIANLQYGWTLFVNPIADKFGWTRAAIQVAFTIFVLTETWLVPVEGYLVVPRRSPLPDPGLLATCEPRDPERTRWWRDRLTRAGWILQR